MGDLTRAELMQQAGLAAGNEQAQSFVRVWLNAWLSRTAKSWTWPLLKLRVADVAVAAGSASKDVGNNQGGVPDKLHRLLNGVIFWRVQSGYSPNGRMMVRPFASTDPSKDANVTDSTIRRGYPSTVRIYTKGGYLRLMFDPVPNVALYLSFDAHYIPANISVVTASDSTVPWYPNDRTLLQACKCAIMELDSGGEGNPAYDNEMGKLAGMVVDDRDFDGAQAGDNEVFGLDPNVFVTGD